MNVRQQIVIQILGVFIDALEYNIFMNETGQTITDIVTVYPQFLSAEDAEFMKQYAAEMSDFNEWIEKSATEIRQMLNDEFSPSAAVLFDFIMEEVN